MLKERIGIIPDEILKKIEKAVKIHLEILCAGSRGRDRPMLLGLG